MSKYVEQVEHTGDWNLECQPGTLAVSQCCALTCNTMGSGHFLLWTEHSQCYALTLALTDTAMLTLTVLLGTLALLWTGPMDTRTAMLPTMFCLPPLCPTLSSYVQPSQLLLSIDHSLTSSAVIWTTCSDQ